MWTRCGSAKTRAPERRGTPSSGFFTWLVNLLHLDATLSSRLARTRSEPPRTPRRRSGSSVSISKAIRSSAAGPKSLGHPGGTSQARSSICPQNDRFERAEDRRIRDLNTPRGEHRRADPGHDVPAGEACDAAGGRERRGLREDDAQDRSTARTQRAHGRDLRSEERRVGKEGRSRGAG